MCDTISFKCPNCNAEYKVVRIEAPPALGNELVCLSCGGPLSNREGKFALKYFRLGGSQGLQPVRGRRAKW
jgi:hypothetical protein